MNKRELIEIVNKQSLKYKKLSYQELENRINKNGEHFEIIYKNKKYWIEVEANHYSNYIIRVMIAGEKKGLFGLMNGYAIYFGKSLNNELFENDEMIF